MFKTKLDDLKHELINYCEFTEEEVDAMFDALLKYNGVIGSTDDIIKILSDATGTDIAEKLYIK